MWLPSFSTVFSLVLCFGEGNDSCFLLLVIIVVEYQNLSLWLHHSLNCYYSEDDRQCGSYSRGELYVWILQIYNYFLIEKWLFKFHIYVFLLIPISTRQTATKHNTEKQRQDWNCIDWRIFRYPKASGDFKWHLCDVYHTLFSDHWNVFF